MSVLHFLFHSSVWDKESPSGRYRAVVRTFKDKKGNEKEYVEVWSGDNKEQSINVTGLEKHGKIYGSDGEFEPALKA